MVSTKIDDGCVKLRPHMPIIEEFSNQMSTETTREQNEALWIWKIDLGHVLGSKKYPGRQLDILILQ